MRRLLNKKSVIMYVLTAFFLITLAFFAVSVSTTDKAYAAQNDFVLDADQLAFDGKTERAQKDTANLLKAGTDNNVIAAQVTKAKPAVKLMASAYGEQIYGGENDAVKVEIKLYFNRWPDGGYGGFTDDATYVALRIYSADDVNFENPLISSEEYGTIGDFVRIFQLSPETVCNSRGKLQSLVLRVESDATDWLSYIYIDYVKIIFNSESLLCGGDCVSGKNPDNLTDENVVWTEAKGYSDTYIDPANYGGFYAYVDNPALVELRKEKFPNVECIKEEDGTETLLLKNAVFALNIGNISPEKYQQFMMDILLTDKRATGGHTLYLYGSDTEKFLDENGNPVGYASKVIVESYEQGFHNKFVLEGEDIQKLAGKDGVISNIYVLYHGNTLDTAEKVVGLRNASQIWVNKIQFLTTSEIESPIVGIEYGKYDISDIFPVGESVRIENKAVETNGDIVSNAALANRQIEELSFILNMESEDNIAFLFNAKGRKKVNEYADGGILFYLSNQKIEISANMDGTTTKAVSMVPENIFNGEKIVKIECVPYYLNSVESGFYCAVWVDGNKLIGDYFGKDYLALGNAFHLCYQAKDGDFSVDLATSKKEGVKAAKDLMNVKVSAEKILYSLDKTDVPLALSWYDTGFDEVSDITCDGDIASVNQVARRIQFNDNGEVKVRFSVTNAFGTFESSELVLRCDDVVKVQDVEQEHFYDSWWFITLYFVPIAAFVAVGIILAIKKAKKLKKVNNFVEEKDEGANK